MRQVIRSTYSLREGAGMGVESSSDRFSKTGFSESAPSFSAAVRGVVSAINCSQSGHMFGLLALG